MDALLVLIYEKPVKLKGTSPLINGGSYEIVPKNFNLKGQLLMFEYQTQQYIYVSEVDYFERHRKNKSLKIINGYCKLSSYENYKRSAKIEDFLKLENWFDQFQFADIGDLFKIEKVELEKSLTNSFSKYFILSKYEFKITSDKIDFSDTLQYPAENTDPSSPNYCKILVKDLDQEFSYSTVDEGNFFTKNFKNKLPSLTLTDSSKQLMYEGIIKICFRIDLIFRNIIDILAIESKQNILTFIKNIPAEADVHDFIDNHTPISPITTIYFTKTDKTIAHLLVDWGYKDFVNTKDFALEINGDQFYEGLYKPFNNYYNALVNLYQNIIGRTESSLFDSPSTLPSTWDFATLTEQDNKRFQFVSLVLPSSAIALLSPKDRINLIESYINLQVGDLSTEAQDNVLKIMHSFYLFPEDGQKFLDFLLDKKDNIHTNFERLFNKFDDDNIRQISPVVGFFANEKTNRRNFIYGLYKIWEKSNYNFNYIPNNNPDEFGLNPDSFFYTDDGKIFFKNNGDKIRNIALEFGTIWQGTAIGTGDTKTIASIEKKYLPSKIDSEKIISSYQFIDVEKTINANQEVINTTAHVSMNSTFPTKVEFHLFQPVTLTGYKVEEELEPTFPQKPYVPAFLWYYSEEFSRLKDFNSTISFAIDVTIEVGLFFLTGGVSAIAELRYLRYASDLAKAIRFGSGTIEYTVLVVKGIGALGQVVTVGSAVCERYYDLLIKIHNPNNDYTAEEKEYFEYLHKFFLNLTLISAGVTVALEYGVRKYAIKLTQDTVKFGKLDTKIQNLVGEIAGLDTAILNTFRNNKLANKPKILAKFDSPDWSIIKRKKFYEDFKILDEADLLRLNDDIALTNWENLLQNNVADRAMVSIVTNTKKTNDIIKYYNEYLFRLKLSDLNIARRRKFFDEFVPIIDDANTFSKLKTKPNVIDLVIEIQNGTRNEKNALDLDFVVSLLKSDLDEDFVDFFIVYTKNSLYDAIYTFSKNIQYTVMSRARVKSLYEGYGFIADTSLYNLEELQNVNTLISNLKIYNNNQLIKNVEQKFLAGRAKNLRKNIFKGNNIPNEITEVSEDINYQIFSKKALDIAVENSKGICRARHNDTEMKMIYDFLKNHWKGGNKFTIDIESLLDPCSNCSLYLGYLKILANKQGKNLDINIISNYESKSTTIVKEMLK